MLQNKWNYLENFFEDKAENEIEHEPIATDKVEYQEHAEYGDMCLDSKTKLGRMLYLVQIPPEAIKCV